MTDRAATPPGNAVVAPERVVAPAAPRACSPAIAVSNAGAGAGGVSDDAPWTAEDEAARARVEKVCARDRQARSLFADALAETRTKKLWRKTHDSFGDYCAVRAPHETRRYCDYLAAFGVLRADCRDMRTMVPIAERPVRDLASLDAEPRRKVIRYLADTRGGLAGITETEVEGAINTVLLFNVLDEKPTKRRRKRGKALPAENRQPSCRSPAGWASERGGRTTAFKDLHAPGQPPTAGTTSTRSLAASGTIGPSSDRSQ